MAKSKKKSNAQIRRMQMRAEKRGEKYVPPSPPIEEQEEVDDPNRQETHASSTNNKDNEMTPMMEFAHKLQMELIQIQENDQLRAKERRSQKRKAEAIAAEEAGCTAEEMQKFLEENQEELQKMEKKAVAAAAAKKKKLSRKSDNNNDNEEEERRHNTPYIVFVGQLAYTTTKEGLWGHIQKELSDEHEITAENTKVRLLTDAKTKKSRGMAFVELDNPELMYLCLRLHHTLLDGRRLNVERSAGGRKKETRQAKIKEFREKQEEYLSNVIDTILADYIKSGELQEGELDDGAIAMCKRYSAGMVETAIKQYVENNGRTMDNTSAYFSFLLGKLASDKAEGLLSSGDSKSKNQGSSSSKGNNNGRPSKRPKKGDGPPGSNKPFNSTVATQSSLAGVDFSMSEKKEASASGVDDNSLSKIFPSLSRGRGRGRGYM